MTETKRGRILRDTNTGPGVVTVDGKQYSFTLGDMWVSDVPPKPGMVVDVLANDQGLPLTLRAVPDSDLAREQAQQALAGVRTQGAELAGKLKMRFGTPLLVATALLVVGWFFLSTVSLRGPGLELTFYQLLGFAGDSQGLYTAVDRSTPSSGGLYGVLAFLALAAPFAQFFWKDRRAALGGWLPLLLMVLVTFQIHSELIGNFEKAAGAFGRSATAQATQMFWKQLGLSFAPGAFLSTAAALYLAWTGTRQFLVNRAPQI